MGEWKLVPKYWIDHCKTCGVERTFQTSLEDGFICGDCSIGFENGYIRIPIHVNGFKYQRVQIKGIGRNARDNLVNLRGK